MMRFVPFAFLLALVAFVPTDVHAQFGPIVPDICKACPCGFGGVLAIVQNVVNFMIAIGVIIATLIMVWGGILYILSPANPENRSTANKMLINAVVGLMITLSAWLIVDFVMKTLYGGQFGPWNSILLTGEGAACIEVTNAPQPLFEGDIFAIPGEADHEGTGSGSNCPAAAASSMQAFPAEALAGGQVYATPNTVQNFLGMRAAALEDGINLKVTSGYRSEQRQVELWNNRGNIGAVARPCSLGGNGSNHNSGVAIDISVGCRNGQTGCNTATYRWLQANATNWNFRNSIPSDPVHWSPTGN